ncbi:MAG TPA: hypothetical protein VNN80_05275, partial [Polyangiaceae bacterium]|nr:hypothetical protein [Polyangiaceae bacterium]
MQAHGARRTVRAFARAWLGTGLLALCACSASGGAAQAARPSLLEPSGGAPGDSASAPAEWHYHPRRPAGLERGYALPDERRLFVGAAGERWLVRRPQRRAEAASMLAPEGLIGALPVADGWAFVGRSGATYAARSPLGPFVSSSAPLVDMAKVDAGERHLLGVARSGELWLSEDAGAVWRRVGPPEARFADVISSGTRALALELPERLWASEDEGRSWRAIARPAFGARSLARDEEAGAVVLSVLGARVAFGPPPELAPLGRVFAPAVPTLDAFPVPGPSARAIARGRAVDAAGRYFELVLGVKAETISGPSLGELERRSAPQLAACSDASVGAFERWVYVACTRERSGSARQLEFYRSDDGGASFEREPYPARGDPDLLHLAVGEGGALLATGLCAPAENAAGCRPRGVTRRQADSGDAGATPALVPVAAPALEDQARALTFSADGRVAYALGPRTKSDALFAFVSADLERGFNARPLAAIDDATSRGTAEVMSFSASEEGQLSLVLRDSSGLERLIVLDADGRTLSVNAAPVDSAVIGAHGDRALAVSPDEVWESLNGGARWQSVGRTPPAVCAPSAGRCAVRVHCNAAGCTVGDSLSRRGWRGRAEPAPVAPARGRPPTAGRALSGGYGCELSRTEWAELRGVDRLPDAAQAAIGKTDWFALATDDSTAAAGLFLAGGSPAPDNRAPVVRYSELLAGSPQAAQLAFYATLQVEGGAALRFRVPSSSSGAAASIAQVEVAWENLFEGQRRRASLPDAGPLRAGDVTKGDGVARRAQPDLVSISSGGIFVRLHRQPQQDQPTYFLDGVHVERVPALAWSLTPVKDASFEMARLGGESVHLAFVDRGATVVRARRGADAWQFDALAFGYADPESFALEQHRDIAYVGGRAAVLSSSRRADGSAQSQLFPLRPDGPVLGEPLAVPTQRDLADALTPCTPRQRADTARVVVPWYPGRRRPLVVHDAVE